MLTLEEFSIAMHLIVLRRNNVPVPDTLPPSLVPRVDSRFSQHTVTTDLVDLGADMFGSGTSADFNFTAKNDKPPPKPEDRRGSPSPPKGDHPSKEWTKFVDSPTSSVSSPGPKPVNFDFQKACVERDPKIFHPVALRVTPDAALEGRASASPRRDDVSLAFEPASPKRGPSQPPDAPPHDVRAIQRPQPRKPLKSAGVLPPPPARDAPMQPQEERASPPKKEPPPPPPPRPLRNHARSSSLDLNRLKGATASNVPVPPPRTSPGATSPPVPGPRRAPPRSEGEYEAEGFGYNREDGVRAQGAFEVYRRGGNAEPEPDVRALLDQNAVLHRVCRALQRDLADVAREREALRVRLATTPDSHVQHP